MRTWHVAGGDLKCGAALGCVVRQGESYCLITGQGWQKVRCAAHAGEPVPAEITASRFESTSLPPGMTRLSEIGRGVTFDPRSLAAGKDE